MGARTWQDMPDWLAFDVRVHHARAAKAGTGAAGEDSVTALTEKIMRDDPEFARILVARYVRSLVRAPKPRKRKRDGARDLLMAECARLSAEGLSLRAIGELKGISRSKVSRLIAECQVRLPEMTAELARLSRGGVTSTPPLVTPPRDSDPNVIPLRRPA